MYKGLFIEGPNKGQWQATQVKYMKLYEQKPFDIYGTTETVIAHEVHEFHFFGITHDKEDEVGIWVTTETYNNDVFKILFKFTAELAANQKPTRTRDEKLDIEYKIISSVVQKNIPEAKRIIKSIL